MVGYFERKNHETLLAEVIRLYPAISLYVATFASDYDPDRLMLRIQVNPSVAVDYTQHGSAWTVFLVDLTGKGNASQSPAGRPSFGISSLTTPAHAAARALVEYIAEYWQVMQNYHEAIQKSSTEQIGELPDEVLAALNMHAQQVQYSRDITASLAASTSVSPELSASNSHPVSAVPAPGHYPFSDGTRRYWDGANWHEPVYRAAPFIEGRVSGFVCGLIGAVLCSIFFVAIPLGIVGILNSRKALDAIPIGAPGRGLPVAGLTLSVVAIVLTIPLTIYQLFHW